MAEILEHEIFKHIFLNEEVWILIRISLRFVPNGVIDNNQALVYIMAWRRIGDKPFLKQCWPDSLTHIWGTRGRWLWCVMYLTVVFHKHPYHRCPKNENHYLMQQDHIYHAALSLEISSETMSMLCCMSLQWGLISVFFSLVYVTRCV